jgi:RNA polymerase sigma-70 factor (ECF subfamily)
VEPTEHLFRRESGRILAALTRTLGVHRLSLAEDAVQDALCRALETWKYHGVPENPAAWLMAAARNRALDVLRRERTARRAVTSLELSAARQETAPSEQADDEVRMMFSCCHPRLPEEAQVALVLNILCGFSANEIATAFLASKASLEKRLSRGKRVLATSKRLFDPADARDGAARLKAVQRALYLLFNEGYHGGSAVPVRQELCDEARRLLDLLLAHPQGATPTTRALGALMCLHAARQPARVGADGLLRTLGEQDRSLWDPGLVAEGLRWLDASAEGSEVSAYHVEAAIAAVHAQSASAAETPWPTVVELYDRLLRLRPSPVVALGRALALAEAEGAAAGLTALATLPGRERLTTYPFFEAAHAELAWRLGDVARARRHFVAALALARNPLERRFWEARLAACEGQSTSEPRPYDAIDVRLAAVRV